MTQVTIPAQVVNGHLHHDADLVELEGQRVIATLTVVPKETANGKAVPTPDVSPEFDPEPPPWLEVENDVYFPMKGTSIPLGKVPVRIKQGKPSIILPEELPDE